MKVDWGDSSPLGRMSTGQLILRTVVTGRHSERGVVIKEPIRRERGGFLWTPCEGGNSRGTAGTARSEVQDKELKLFEAPFGYLRNPNV